MICIDIKNFVLANIEITTFSCDVETNQGAPFVLKDTDPLADLVAPGIIAIR